MNFKMMLTLTTITMTIVACAKTSSGTSSSNASNVLTIYPMSSQVAPGGTTTVEITGGTGVYPSAGAMQGRLTPLTTTTFQYTAPTTATQAFDTLTVGDSSGAVATTTIMITGAASSAAATGSSPFTTTSCQGDYTMNIGGVTAQLNVVQNVSNQISGFLLINKYYYPINGNCSVTVGATSGTMSFVNLIMNQTYSASVGQNSGRLVLNGSVQTSATAYNFTGYSAALTAAPLASNLACDGDYAAMIDTNGGELHLISNGSGKVGGYLALQGYFYAFTGNCGTSVSLRNLTNGSSYVGAATINGASVTMNGTFTTSLGATHSWSATK